MENLIFNVLVAVVVALIGIITRSLLPFLKAKKEEATAKLRQTRWSWAADIVDAVVRAVEQTVSEGIHGKEKKEEAKAIIRRMLVQNGLNLSVEQVDTLIEAAVQAMNADIAMMELEAPESMEEAEE